MIKYHGTPIGGSRQDAARFLVGRSALVPFARPDDLAVVMDVCASFVLDNSAFSYWQKGAGRVPFDDYMAWVRSIYRHPGFDWALIPDVIDGDVEENARLVRDWLRCGPKFKGVPVWHLHEPLEYLEWLVANFETVAIGSSGQWRTPGAATWWTRMAEALRVACDAQGRPRCDLHGLRMLDPEIFTRIPFRSADSTNAAVNCGAVNRFGMYPAPTSSQRAAVIAEIIEHQNSPAVWSAPAHQGDLLACDAGASSGSDPGSGTNPVPHENAGAHVARHTRSAREYQRRCRRATSAKTKTPRTVGSCSGRRFERTQHASRRSHGRFAEPTLPDSKRLRKPHSPQQLRFERIRACRESIGVKPPAAQNRLAELGKSSATENNNESRERGLSPDRQADGPHALGLSTRGKIGCGIPISSHPYPVPFRAGPLTFCGTVERTTQETPEDRGRWPESTGGRLAPVRGSEGIAATAEAVISPGT